MRFAWVLVFALCVVSEALGQESWTSQDVGSVGTVGNTAYNGRTGVFTIQGAGGGVGGSSDAFQFSYTQVSGSSSILAHVGSLTNTGSGAVAGVMVRETPEAGSAYVGIFVTPGNGVVFSSRTEGGVVSSVAVASLTAPVWLKVERRDNAFTGYESSDGVSWTVVGRVAQMMTLSADSGLAVSSGVSGTLSTGVFDSVSVKSTGVLAAGLYHNLELKGDGTLWAWGYNYFGELGNGMTTDSSVPVEIFGVSPISALEAGFYHSLALKSDGTVWAWGFDGDGELGNGTATSSSQPAQISGFGGVTELSAGGYHNLALKGDGSVWTWGYNHYGELGNGTKTNALLPIQVSGLSDMIAVAGGGYHSLALKSDGTVWAWGYNNDGQLGNGTTTLSTTPVQVSGLTGIVAIAGGAYHSLALRSDGTVWAWGLNNCGQLGNNTTTNSKTPVQVGSLSGITAIRGGFYHSVALRSDGTVWTWGYNYDGELGNGTGVNSKVPVQPSGLGGNITAIAAGGYHTAVLRGDGIVWTWGDNEDGELGNNTLVSSTIPVSELQPVTAAPTLSLPGGNYHSSQSVTITGPDGSTIYYTTDGSTPTALSPSGTSPVTLTVNGTTTLQALAVQGGYQASSIASAEYDFTAVAPTVSQPTATYSSAPSVTFTPADPGETITYTTDGTDPTTSPTAQTWDGGTPLNITTTTTLEYVASENGYATSPVQSATYTIDPTTSLIPRNGLQTWLRADTGVVLNGMTVSQWTDQSGHQFNALQPTAASQPTLQHDSLTDPTALAFDGASTYLTLPSGYSDFTQGSTVILVTQPGGTTGDFLDLGNGAASDNLIFGLNANSLGGLTTQTFNGSTPSSLNTPSGVAPGNYQILENIQSTANIATQYDNGTPLGSGLLNPLNNLTRADNYLGTTAAGGTSYYPGTITEILIYNRALTDPERQAIETYLNTRYPQILDTDGNGLPDAWELQYFGKIGNDPASSPDGNGLTLLQDYQQGNDPTNYYSQNSGLITPTLAIISGDNQSLAPGTYSPNPLVVQVTDSATGLPLTNAPLTLTASTGGQLSLDGLTPLGTTATLRTDPSGYTQVYLQMAPTGATSFTVTATAGTASLTTSPFTASQPPPQPPTITPRYAVIDLGTNMRPVSINNSNKVTAVDGQGQWWWLTGTNKTTLSVPSKVQNVLGFTDSGIGVGTFGIDYYDITLDWGDNNGLGHITHVLRWNALTGGSQEECYTLGSRRQPNNGDDWPPDFFYVQDLATGDWVEVLDYRAYSMNTNGDVAGYNNFIEGNFIWSAGQAQVTGAYPPVGQPLGQYVDYDVNNTGLFINNTGGSVGFYSYSLNGADGTLIYTNNPTNAYYFPWEDDETTFANYYWNVINDANVVLGEELSYFDGSDNTAIWQQGNINTNLGPGYLYALNNTTNTNGQPAPQILGYLTNGLCLIDYTDNQGNPTNAYVPKPLQQLIAGSTNSTWAITGAAGLNDYGLIAGNANYAGTNTNIATGPHAVLLLPVQIKTPSMPYGGNNSVHPVGPINNIVSEWPNDSMVLQVDSGGVLNATNLPPNFIQWSAPDHTISANQLSATLVWSTPGTRQVVITVSGTIYRVVIDVPDVGSYSETFAAALDPIEAAMAFQYAQEAMSWAAIALPDDPNNNGTEGANALQHSCWNALMASDLFIGPAEALFFSTAHEYTGKASAGGLAYDSTMDLHNNYIGSLVIHRSWTGSADSDAIHTDLLGRLSAGDLWIIKQEPTGDHVRHVIKSNGKKVYPLN